MQRFGDVTVPVQSPQDKDRGGVMSSISWMSVIRSGQWGSAAHAPRGVEWARAASLTVGIRVVAQRVGGASLATAAGGVERTQ
jgi:hypothetical protein